MPLYIYLGHFFQKKLILLPPSIPRRSPSPWANFLYWESEFFCNENCCSTLHGEPCILRMPDPLHSVNAHYKPWGCLLKGKESTITDNKTRRKWIIPPSNFHLEQSTQQQCWLLSMLCPSLQVVTYPSHFVLNEALLAELCIASQLILPW